MYRVVWCLALAACGRLGFGHVPDGAGGDGAGASDGAADVLPPADALPPCVPLAISDNFDDGVMASFWLLLANNPVNVAETGGQLQIMLATAGGAHFGGYYTSPTYDLRDHCITVTYVTVPANQPMTEMDFSVMNAGSTLGTGFSFHNGVMDPYENLGTYQSLGGVPYDPALHKVMRYREDAGTMTWEVSPDGVTFHVVATHATPFDVSAIYVLLQAGTYGSEPSPGNAAFDNFDL
jgi:hypothetical protein